MRNEIEMFDLILDVAQVDDRIRAVIMNGSRANPNAPCDIFQDFDIVYVVADIAPFKNNPEWVKRFGEIMIMQLPDDMPEPSPSDASSYAYLIQFADGNRIDLTFASFAHLAPTEPDSLSVLLLDKDGVIAPFGPPSEKDYLPQPPTAKAFADCCNEFWWVAPYVAKGLWRQEIIYAKSMLEQFVREQLMHMLVWHIGMQTHFRENPGKLGKYFERYLEPDWWAMLLNTYAGAGYDATWEALLTMCDLFRLAATAVAAHFGFDYPHGDDARVTAHLQHVRSLP
ncbi:MAG: aminoglycoside 6-adenylyltransferase, partial [Anaerolineae bacterium]|nr:aminoglycoside 6-adenylyltransferase [Anaerolineae bacterium]